MSSRNVYKSAFAVSLFMLGVTSWPARQALARDNHATPQATIREKQQTIKTYPFYDPNPVPSLAIDEDRFRFYPYFVWNGFSHRAQQQKWKVIHLENRYIKLSVLPQVGGKVWGAVDKATGRQFIYKNKVLKFRAIGIRGPWTSGGIEHDFGLDLGHAPWTASPVDYKIQSNNNGSVDVVVGGLDLASRTQWRVTIKLPKNKAYFETNSLWYNPLPLPQSYLSWENTAVHAGNDLQFFYPGQHTIPHDGIAHPWPIGKKGRNLSYYRNNNFKGNKSYHVMGKYSDWYGAYWHSLDFGFGHWAPYTDAPGKKIWIWSLAPRGAIWKHLLTDHSGQYVELQSGVKFNQANFGSGRNGPFGQLIFAPDRTDIKHEIWFPFSKTGGMVDASPYGVLNVTRKANTLRIRVNALQTLHSPLTVRVDARLVYKKQLDLQPMGLYRARVLLPAHSETVHVAVGKHELVYDSNPSANNLERPVTSPTVKADQGLTPARLLRLADNQMSMRLYGKALRTYSRVLKQEPTQSRALTRVAEIYYREGRYRQGLDYARRVLQQNTYDPGANFIYGALQRRLGDLVDAKDGLSVAARSLKYRSGAYVQLASILIQERNFKRALVYAHRALNYNNKNLTAYRVLAIAYRHLHQKQKAEKVLRQLLGIDPLNHFARFEQYLLIPTKSRLKAFKTMIRNEFPDQTYLELAMTYVHADLTEEAVRVLKQAPADPIVDYWLAYLTRNATHQHSQRYLSRALTLSPRFVFPFRLETLPVLEWAMRQNNAWKTKYYLGLIYWSKLRTRKAKRLFERCRNIPSFAPFYIARGALFEDQNPDKAAQNFKKAIQVASSQWRGWDALIALYNRGAEYAKALHYAKRAYRRFPDNQYIGLDYATSLLNNRRYGSALSVLKQVHVLPAEHARQGHRIYQKANIMSALTEMKNGDYKQAIKRLRAAKQWPEHLGKGRPYGPDSRMQDYLLALSYRRLGRPKRAAALFDDVGAYTEKHLSRLGANAYLGVLAFQLLGKAEKARQLLNAWRKSHNVNSKIAQWATAKPGSKAHRARQSGQKLAVKGNVGLRWDSEWAILHQAVQLSRR